MKNKRFAYLLETFIAPAVMIIAGLILLINPDSATALITSIVAWVLVAIGVIVAVSMLMRKDYKNPVSWIQIVVCLGLGIFFLIKPLFLAKIAGRILGVILVFEGIRNVMLSVSNFGKILSVVTAVVGAVLVFLPMSLSRIILRILGAVLLAVGIANVLDWLMNRKKLEKGHDANIVDADE